jgi:hypothetical protein
MREPKHIPTALEKRLATQAQAPTNGKALTVAAAQVPALRPGADYRARYMAEEGSVGFPGPLVKFTKEAKFARTDTKEDLPEDAHYIAIIDELWVGLVKFGGPGEPPEKIGGLIYSDDFVMPDRATLGDSDESQWPVGISGQPEDPWQRHNYLPLQHSETKELMTFGTSSKTGRVAVRNLMNHYDRLRRRKPDHLPVVRLSVGGFQKDRVGWVSVPVFVAVTSVPRDEAASPDTSTEAILNDALPENMR